MEFIAQSLFSAVRTPGKGGQNAYHRRYLFYRKKAYYDCVKKASQLQSGARKIVVLTSFLLNYKKINRGLPFIDEYFQQNNSALRNASALLDLESLHTKHIG